MFESISSFLGGALGIFYFILFFGGSVFVHELGHFLAARKRGMKVERFSIGFGPRLFGWTGKDGVDYRVSLLPLGGYVSVPQLADPTGIEGETATDAAEMGPPASYLDKVIVLTAGVVFNILFAFLLACVLWVTGRPVPPNFTTTTVGDVVAEFSPGKPSPAAAAGLLPGDKILSVDGSSVADFSQIINRILLGSGRDAEGNPSLTLRILREGKELELTAKPELRNPTGDRARVIGISPAGQIVISSEPLAGYPAALAGLKQGDSILALNGEKLWSFEHFERLLSRHASPEASGSVPREITLRVRGGGGVERDVRITPVLRSRTVDLLKIACKDKGLPRELTLVPVPKDALAKTPPAPKAPREALMLYSIGNLSKDSKLAEVLRPGMLLASVEQKGGFTPVRTADELVAVPPSPALTLVFSEEGGSEQTVTLEDFSARLEPARKTPLIGAACATKATFVHQNPLEQLNSVFRLTFDSLGALLNRNTDVGPNQLMGVISMGRIYLGTDSILQVIWFTIMINISLAILNILPIPVLDGGHILFATLQKVRGKPVAEWLNSALHYFFMILLFSAMGYVLFNDVKRCSRDNTAATRDLIYERYVHADFPVSKPQPQDKAAAGSAETNKSESPKTEAKKTGEPEPAAAAAIPAAAVPTPSTTSAPEPAPTSATPTP